MPHRLIYRDGIPRIRRLSRLGYRWDIISLILIRYLRIRSRGLLAISHIGVVIRLAALCIADSGLLGQVIYFLLFTYPL